MFEWKNGTGVISRVGYKSIDNHSPCCHVLNTFSCLGPPPKEYFEELETEIARLSQHSNNVELIRAVLVAGMYPNVASIVQSKKVCTLQTLDDGRVSLYPSSVLFREKQLPYRWLVFTDKVGLTFIHNSFLQFVPSKHGGLYVEYFAEGLLF